MEDEVLFVLQGGADILVCVPSSRLNFTSLSVWTFRFGNGEWTMENSFVVSYSKSTRSIFAF